MASLRAEMWRRVDQRLMAGWWTTISVPAERTRRWLRGRRLAFIDPEQPPPAMADVQRTADIVIARYANSAALLGAAAGLGGLLSVPPELAANLVAVLRLGQRLCVVYGFDPESDRGHMALWQALAKAYGVDLPASGLVGLRAADLPSLLRAAAPTSVSGALVNAAVRGSAWRLLGRVTRFVPIVAAASQAAHERRQMDELGRAMSETLRQLADGPMARGAGIEDAVELD
jgi:hypothetical protein